MAIANGFSTVVQDVASTRGRSRSRSRRAMPSVRVRRQRRPTYMFQGVDEFGERCRYNCRTLSDAVDAVQDHRRGAQMWDDMPISLGEVQHALETNNEMAESAPGNASQCLTHTPLEFLRCVWGMD